MARKPGEVGHALLLKVVVHVASLQDRAGVRLLLDPVRDAFPRMRKVWVDSGYSGSGKEWVEAELGWEVEVVQHAAPPRGVWVPPASRSTGACSRGPKASAICHGGGSCSAPSPGSAATGA